MAGSEPGPALAPELAPDDALLLSRDLRARRLDQEWLIHLRADVPTMAGIRLSDSAMALVSSIGTSARASQVADGIGHETAFRVLRDLIGLGLVLPTRWTAAAGAGVDEVLALRSRIPADDAAALELEHLATYVAARSAGDDTAAYVIGGASASPAIAIGLGMRAGGSNAKVTFVCDHEYHRKQVLAVDPSRQLPSQLPRIEQDLEAAGLSSGVELWTGDPDDPSIVDDAPVHLVYIEAAHSFEHLDRDLEAWLPRIAPDGYLMVHGYGNSLRPEVGKVVDGHRPRMARFNVIQTLAIGRPS
jgi:hypothetical protein